MPTVPIIFKDKYTVAVFAASAIILVIAFSMAYVNFIDNNNLLVIHFDSFKGTDFFGNKTDIWNIFLIAAVIWIINIFLANEFYFRERLLSYVLVSSTLLFAVLILAGVNVIINVN